MIERGETGLLLDLLERLPATDPGATEIRAWVHTPGTVRRLHAGAEALRHRAGTDELLRETVATLEHVRVALLRLSSGMAGVEDLTGVLARANDIGRRVDAVIAAAVSGDPAQR